MIPVRCALLLRLTWKPQWGGVLAIAILFAAFAWGLPFLAFCATIVWLSISMTRSATVVTAVLGSIAIVLVGLALVATWSYLVPVSMSALQMMFLLACLVLGTFTRAANIGREGTPRGAIVFAAIPGVLTFLALQLQGNLTGLNLGWMLSGDAQNNTVAAREIVLHNGADPAFFPSPALTQVLFGSAAAWSRNPLQTDGFISLIQTQAIALAGLWALTSIAFGFVAVREFEFAPKWVQMVAGFTAACVPLSWFIVGFSIDAGFYNTPAALFTLAASWLFWRETANQPSDRRWISLSLQIVAFLLALMAWVPIALVPAALLFATAWRIVFVDKEPRQLLNGWVLLGAISVAIYLVAVVLPSFMAHGQGLAGEGWMTEFSPVTVVVVVLLALLTAVVVYERKPGSQTVGMFAVLFGISFALAFLLYSSISAGAGWSYYPRKFAWMTTFFLMFLASVLAITATIRLRPAGYWRKPVAVLSIIGLFGVGLLSVPFTKTGPLKLFPLFWVAVNGEDVNGAVPEVAESLGSKNIRLKYNSNDFIVNQWSFQWTKFNGPDGLWSFAYSQIKSPSDVCIAANQWGGGVTLLTQSEHVRSDVLAECGELIAEVR